LAERGYFENTDRKSPVFNFKFAIRSSDCLTDQLQENQIVNHFAKNSLITTKCGLTNSLKNIIWWNTVSIDEFYPKCFDLTDMQELDDFRIEFRGIKVESILRKFVDKEGLTKCIELIIVALNCLRKRLQDIDDVLDEPFTEDAVTDLEWKLLEKEKVDEEVLADVKRQPWFSAVLNKHDSFIEQWREEGKVVERERKNLATIMEEEEKK